MKNDLATLKRMWKKLNKRADKLMEEHITQKEYLTLRGKLDELETQIYDLGGTVGED